MRFFAPAGLALLRRGRLRGVPVLRGTVTHDIASLARASPLARPSLSPARGDSVVFPTSRHCVPHPRACCSFTIKLLSQEQNLTHKLEVVCPACAALSAARRRLSRCRTGTLCTLETGQTTDAVTALSRVRDQGPREDVGSGFGVRTRTRPRRENDTSNVNVIDIKHGYETITISVSDPIVVCVDGQSGTAAGSRMRCGVANDYVLRGM